MFSDIREKKHRLDRKEYTGCKRVSFTLCVQDRGRIFDSENVINVFIDILRKTIEENKVRNRIYVFMPDHVHLVLEGLEYESDLWKTVKLFKQRTGVWMSKNSRYKWQKDFYDRIIREDSPIYHTLKYIVYNPVRNGLIEEYKRYKGLGSLDFDIKDIIENIEMVDKIKQI